MLSERGLAQRLALLAVHWLATMARLEQWSMDPVFSTHIRDSDAHGKPLERTHGDDRPAHDGYDFLVRADPRHNVVGRVLWRMCSLALRHGYCTMRAGTLADEMEVDVAAVKRARKRIVKLGLFKPPRYRNYEPALRPGESRDIRGRRKHWQRMRATPAISLVLRAEWLLVDLTSRDRSVIPVTLALTGFAALLGTSERSAKRALAEVLEFGRFVVVESGGGAGYRNTYARRTGVAGVPATMEGNDEEAESADYAARFQQAFDGIAREFPEPRRGPRRPLGRAYADDDTEVDG
jgi:hypothetical protein